MKARLCGMWVVAALALPERAAADPALECGLGNGSQIEIGRCVEDMERRVDHALAVALGFARDASARTDEATGRPVAVPALEAGQAAWAAYRDGHCAFVGATFGGGSGTGIGMRACRVELGRVRVAQLMTFAR